MKIEPIHDNGENGSGGLIDLLIQDKKGVREAKIVEIKELRNELGGLITKLKKNTIKKRKQTLKTRNNG